MNTVWILRSGKIDPWGTIAMPCYVPELLEKLSEDPISDGLWSDRLVVYGNDEYYANVRYLDSKFIYVVNKKSHLVVESIPRAEFKDILVSEHDVSEEGRLLQEYNTLHILFDGRLVKEDTIDCRPFIQIDKSFAGQKVIAIVYDKDERDEGVVYTKEGKLIPSTFHYPSPDWCKEEWSKWSKYLVP